MLLKLLLLLLLLTASVYVPGGSGTTIHNIIQYNTIQYNTILYYTQKTQNNIHTQNNT
jgi:hypothetical protein